MALVFLMVSLSADMARGGNGSDATDVVTDKPGPGSADGDSSTTAGIDVRDGTVSEEEDTDREEEASGQYMPSPEPEESVGEEASTRSELIAELPPPDAEGGRDKSVLVLNIHDTIDMGVSAFVSRSLSGSSEYAAVIFDINTPGGRVDAATKIRDAIMAMPRDVYSVAFIHPRAISAGAFISFACDFIFISDGGSIGAATPVSLQGNDASPVDEKYVSYFRAEMAATARAKGRNGKIAEAMVDADVAIEDVTVKGKLLTLDTNGALIHGIANDRANDLKSVKERIALPKAQSVVLEMTWAEKLARILTSPMLTGILMTIGMLGIFIELYHPGFGLPGIVGVTCLTIFFMGHMVVHLAGMEELALFIIGVVLLMVEAFVIPGFGVVGVLGVGAILGSLVLSLTALPVTVSFETGMLTAAVGRVAISVVATVVLMLVAVVVLPRRRFMKNRLVLETVIGGTSGGSVNGKEGVAPARVNEIGIAESALRPAGIGRFSGNRVDVVSDGGFIDKGETIEVIAVEGNRVSVRLLSKESSTVS